MVDRTRVSYAKGMRSDAKAKQAGLITISVTMPNGDRIEEQSFGSVDQCRFAKWAAAMLFCEEVRDLPNLEDTIKTLMRNNQ